MIINENIYETYQLTRNWKIFHFIFGIVYIGSLGVFLSEAISSIQSGAAELSRLICFFPYFLIYCLGSAGVHIYNMFFARLIISSDGLEYHTCGMHTSVKWTDVAGLSFYKTTFYRWTGLSIKSEKNIKGWLGPLSLPFLTQERTLIPISIFEKDWQKGRLGQKIGQYIPNLLLEK